MRMIRYLSLLLILFWGIMARGQNVSDFNPDSPLEPGRPVVTDPTNCYTLTLRANIEGAVSGGGRYEAGDLVMVLARKMAGYAFTGWVDEAGDTLSHNASFAYTMPAADATLTACYVFRPDAPYEPGNPVLPDKPGIKPVHQLAVTSQYGTVSLDGIVIGTSGTKELEEGATAIVTVRLADNILFGGWYSADTLYSANKNFIFTMGTEDVTLVARYSFTPLGPGDPSLPVMVKNEMSLRSVNAFPGGVVDYPIYLNCDDSIRDVSMLVMFPKGMEANFAKASVSDEMADGDFMFEPLDASDEDLSDPTLSAILTTHNIYRLTLTNCDLAPTYTPLLIVPVAVSDTVSGGSHSVRLANVLFTLNNDKVVVGTTRDGEIVTSGSVRYMVDGVVFYSAVCETGEKIPTAPTPQKTGHTFAGWDGMPADSIMASPNLTLTALWTVNEYVLTYISDGVVYHRDTLAYGMAVTSVTPPVKAGYDFGGWSVMPATMPAEDITVTALWQQQIFSVTYMVDGAEYRNVLCGTDDKIEEVHTPEKPGHTFVGWDGMPTDGLMPPHDLTLTALWTVNEYVLTYISDGVVYHRDTLAYGSAVTSVTPPEKIGHTFTGWDGMPVDNIVPAHDVTLTAQWKVNEYVLTYMSDGSLFHSETLAYGSEIPYVIPPVNPNGTFLGWYGMPADNIMPPYDLTLTARWQNYTYALTYIIDGEQLRVDSVAYGAVIEPATPAARIGCQFGGWEGLPPTMPAQDVEVHGYNHIIDTDSVVLDGHLTTVMLAELNALRQVRVLNIADVTDGAVAIGGLGSLQKASLPKTLTSYEGTLTNCPNLMEIVAEGTTEIPANAFSGSGTNANMIVYAPAGTDAQYAGNVVIGGHADEVVLVDGSPVSISREFTAARISYTRNFVKTSYLYECAGWETIVLPFDVEMIEHKGSSLAPFKSDMDGEKNFWLARLTSYGFSRFPRIEANIPYIICMPNSEEYDDWYNISGDVTFSATNATVHRTADARVFSCNEFDLVPSYSTVEGGVTVYPLNDDEHDGHRAGSVFVSNLRDVRPFEAYARRSPSAPLRMMLSIGDMSPTGIMEVNAPDKAAGTECYDLLGRPTTSSHKGIRITRDSKGRRVVGW